MVAKCKTKLKEKTKKLNASRIKLGENFKFNMRFIHLVSIELYSKTENFYFSNFHFVQNIWCNAPIKFEWTFSAFTMTEKRNRALCAAHNSVKEQYNCS